MLVLVLEVVVGAVEGGLLAAGSSSSSRARRRLRPAVAVAVAVAVRGPLHWLVDVRELEDECLKAGQHVVVVVRRSAVSGER